jgi:hypothetical protein
VLAAVPRARNVQQNASGYGAVRVVISQEDLQRLRHFVDVVSDDYGLALRIAPLVQI